MQRLAAIDDAETDRAKPDRPRRLMWPSGIAAAIVVVGLAFAALVLLWKRRRL
jgi:hypothetical protein